MSSLYEVNGQPLKVLISEEKLQARIAELGAQITKDYQGKELVVVGVLRGAFLFLADLVRQIDLPVITEFLALSSYGNRTSSSGVVRLTYDLSTPIMGRDVLVVEDIIDTGLTMNYLLENLKWQCSAYPDVVHEEPGSSAHSGAYSFCQVLVYFLLVFS